MQGNKKFQPEVIPCFPCMKIRSVRIFLDQWIIFRLPAAGRHLILNSRLSRVFPRDLVWTNLNFPAPKKLKVTSLVFFSHKKLKNRYTFFAQEQFLLWSKIRLCRDFLEQIYLSQLFYIKLQELSSKFLCYLYYFPGHRV